MTVQDARDMNMWCEFVVNRGAPSNVGYEESRERSKMGLRKTLATFSLTNPRSAPEGLPVPVWKAAAYFAVPAPMRERLWPWRQRHLEIFAQLQQEGKMPTPPTCNKCSTLKAPAACNNFKAAQLQQEGKMPTRQPATSAHGCRHTAPMTTLKPHSCSRRAKCQPRQPATSAQR